MEVDVASRARCRTVRAWFPCTVVAPADPASSSWRRSSARWWPSCPSTTRRTPSPSPTTPPTGCQARSGADGRRRCGSPRSRGDAFDQLQLVGRVTPLRRFKQRPRPESRCSAAAYSELKTVFFSTRLKARRRRRLADAVARRADRGDDAVGVLAVADLHGDLHAGLAHVQVHALPHVLDLDDVRLGLADDVQQPGQAARAIGDAYEEDQASSGQRLGPPDETGQDSEVDVAAREHDRGHAGRRGRHALGHQRGDTDRPAPLDEELGPLHQEHHGVGHLVLSDGDDVVHPRVHQRARQQAGRLDRDAVGQRRDRPAGTDWFA